MEDAMRRGTSRTEQWFSQRMAVDKEEKRVSGLGALDFIRSRGSMRRQLMRDSTNR